MIQEQGDPDLAAVIEGVEICSRKILEEGRWSSVQDRALDQSFAQATQSAIRAASVTERSVLLRRVFRHLVPDSIKPVVKALARRVMTRQS